MCIRDRYNKVQYYNGTKLGYHSSYPIVITDTNCPKVAIACGGNVQTVRSYFGSTAVSFKIRHTDTFKKGTLTRGNGLFQIHSHEPLQGIAPGQFGDERMGNRKRGDTLYTLVFAVDRCDSGKA